MPSITATNSISDNMSIISKSVGALLTNAGVSAPTNFPNNLTASISTSIAFAIASGYSAPTNGNTGITTTAGTTVSRITSASPTISLSGGSTAQTYSGGPGDSGTLTMSVNGLAGATYTLTTGNTTSGTPDSGAKTGSTSGGVSTSFTIANNVAFPSAPLVGFFETFQISAMSASSLPAGFNRISLAHSAAGTLTVSPNPLFYDNQGAPIPNVTPTSVSAPGSPTLLYPSGIPHYTSANNFTLNYTIQNISGNLYANSPSLSVSTAGAFSAPTTRSTWPSINASLTTPLTANNTTTHTGIAFSLPIITGFGQSATKPTIAFSNGYGSTGGVSTTSLAGWTGRTVLYKTGTSNTVEETNISTTAISGTTGQRIIISPNTGDNAPYTGSESTYTPADASIGSSEAKNVANTIRYDVTDYSTGFLPVGPNYSTHDASQYFTFKFTKKRQRSLESFLAFP